MFFKYAIGELKNLKKKDEIRETNINIAISYHNIGIQEELFGNFIKASKNYLYSINILEDANLKKEPLFSKLKICLENFFKVIGIL